MMPAHLMNGEVGVVPLHGIAALLGHDVKPFEHDGRNKVQTPKVQPPFVRELTPCVHTNGGQR